MEQVAFYTLKLTLGTRDDILREIDEWLVGSVSRQLFFLNAHCFNLSLKVRMYHDALSSADMVLNDGSGIAFAARIGRVQLSGNLNGTDLIPLVIAHAAKFGSKLYLLGGKPGVAALATRKIANLWPDVRVVGVHDGYFDRTEERRVIDEIRELKVNLLIVAMGVPRQELWLLQHRTELDSVSLSIAGGAVLDFISDTVRRAPVWMRRAGVEWVYRLWLEPGRMWRRYLIGNLTFVWNVFRLRGTHLKAQWKTSRSRKEESPDDRNWAGRPG